MLIMLLIHSPNGCIQYQIKILYNKNMLTKTILNIHICFICKKFKLPLTWYCIQFSQKNNKVTLLRYFSLKKFLFIIILYNLIFIYIQDWFNLKKCTSFSQGWILYINMGITIFLICYLKPNFLLCNLSKQILTIFYKLYKKKRLNSIIYKFSQ